MQFVDVKNDIAFRKIFGNEKKKKSLISFLNATLNFQEGNLVVDVEIKNPYQLPELKGGKTTIIDVKATDQNKNVFLVELQVAEAKEFDKRVLYYASKSVTDQISRGDEYPKIKPTYFIGILNFKATKNMNFLSRHRILDIETQENYLKNIEFTFIELPKFHKKAEELSNIIEQWVFFIKNAENLELIPENITDEGVKEAFSEAAKHNWTKEELQVYDEIFMRQQDEKGRYELALERAWDEGIEKGKVEGRVEGKVEGKIEEKYSVIDNGIEFGMSLESLSKLTGLSVEEIQKYLDSKKNKI